MSVPVTYMGTKRQLAGDVSKIVGQCCSGIFLDAFAGMCSVGSAVGTSRSVWSNDQQKFAEIVAKAYFTCKEPINSKLPIVERFLFLQSIAFEDIICKLHEEISREREALSSGCLESLEELYNQGSTRHSKQLCHRTSVGNFTDRYAGTYFGFSQCAEIDSIRETIEKLITDEEIDQDGWRWLLIALARAISKVSTTTGHFAQPLKPKRGNIDKFIAQRNRSVLVEWRAALDVLAPLGNKNWRLRNKVFNEDADQLLSRFRRTKLKPSVIYADPPYTKDQYSRYYHIYETLVLNDNPSVSGRGLYRNDRFTSKYCLSSQVSDAIETLIAQCAEIEADLILSYPTNGLLADSTSHIPKMFYRHFRKNPTVIQLPHIHSTLGGSKGKPKNAVTELIYWSGCP